MSTLVRWSVIALAVVGIALAVAGMTGRLSRVALGITLPNADAAALPRRAFVRILAPDEADALATLASRAAIARDDLLAQALRAELAASKGRERQLGERLAALERENHVLARAAGVAPP